MISQIISHSILSTPIVRILETVFAHRNKLTLVIRCARRLGIPFHSSRPKDILFAMSHAVDIVLQLFIGIDWHMLDKIIIIAHLSEKMVSTIFGKTSHV